MNRVLLIDDDVGLCEMLVEYLASDGFEVKAVHEGPSGVEHALAGIFDAIVLDVMLPGMNGMEVLRRVRAGSRTPVLMLTARGEVVDRILGLEMGADDYLAKPCNPRELVARLRAVLRRTQPAEADTPVLKVGALEVHPATRRAELAGGALDLTSTEFNLLELLARHAGRVVSKETLSEEGLGRPLTLYDRSIDMHMSKLRRKLGITDLIQTVRGMGYQLTAE